MSGQACFVCGAEREPIEVALVEWLQPIDGVIWTAGPRCRDRQACRRRLEAQGEPWPVRDGRTELGEPTLTVNVRRTLEAGRAFLTRVGKNSETGRAV